MSTIVRRQPGDTDDRLIATFRKKALSEDIVGQAKKRARYISPSEERKVKKDEFRRKKKGRRRAARRRRRSK